MYKGIPVSEGFAIGSVYQWHETKLDTSKKKINNLDKEIAFLHETIQKTIDQLKVLMEKSRDVYGEETSKIFEAHLLIAKDPEMIIAVEQKIKNESCNMLFALKTVSDDYVAMFEKLDDAYLKERALDIVDVRNRMIRNALNLSPDEMVLPKKDMILVADELTPSQIASLDLKYVKGFITETGGKTSHSAIMSKLVGLPAIMGFDHAFKILKNDTEIIMDGFTGEVIIDYNHETYHTYLYKRDQYIVYKDSLRRLIKEPTRSQDGHSYILSGQIGSSKDVSQVIENGADGIGLFRTEFLFTNRTKAPTEDEQFVEYKSILEMMKDKPVVIRTIDLGGDKQTPYLQIKSDLNPSLGIRAIRLSIYHQDIIYKQLKALVRASIYGNLSVMFPMVASLEEIFMVKQWIQDIKIEFDSQNIPYTNFPIGIMIEIPSAALMADEFAKHVDFFSIGTNDLIQYTFAADRTSEDLDYLYRPFSPAIIRLIHMAAKAAKDNHIHISVCGEMASDRLALPLLLGMGIDELSMSPSQILKSKDFVLNHHHSVFEYAAEYVLKLSTEKEILKFLKDNFQT
ncbi:MAG: phosphoenolpyruvate--protein phosphotransferase [Acholeplasmataceae bacterium]|jgi:phosphotransferase system enzyme I (PtsI)|nr:phosphoenolpyruvate--protein phosphotransferase [Acholeplasmataceae bacterium]